MAFHLANFGYENDPNSKSRASVTACPDIGNVSRCIFYPEMKANPITRAIHAEAGYILGRI